MRQQNTKVQEKDKNYKIIPTPCPPTPHHNVNQPPLPPYPNYPIPQSFVITKQWTWYSRYMVQMRQSNECGSVRNDEIINLHLRSGAGP